MKRAVLVLLLVLASSGFASGSGFDPNSQHRIYEVPYNVLLGGVGGGLLQGSYFVYVDVDSVQPDDDEVNGPDTYGAVVGISMVGPGSNVITNQGYTIDILDADCLFIVQGVQNTRTSATSSSSATEYDFIGSDNTATDDDKCYTIFRVQSLSGAAVNWELRIPVVIYNSDIETKSIFEELTGASGFEFLATAGVAVFLLLWGASSERLTVRMLAASLAMILGVLVMVFTSNAVVFVLAAAIGLGASVLLFLMVLDRMRTVKKGPTKFFE